METFLLGLYDRYNILLREDNMLCINEDIFIFLSENDNRIILLCPCFPLPEQQTDLVGLLALNCKNEITFCCADELIMAKLIMNQDDDFDGMMDKFGWYVHEIIAARDCFSPGPRQQIPGRVT